MVQTFNTKIVRIHYYYVRKQIIEDDVKSILIFTKIHKFRSYTPKF